MYVPRVQKARCAGESCRAIRKQHFPLDYGCDVFEFHHQHQRTHSTH